MGSPVSSSISGSIDARHRSARLRRDAIDNNEDDVDDVDDVDDDVLMHLTADFMTLQFCGDDWACTVFILTIIPDAVRA